MSIELDRLALTFASLRVLEPARVNRLAASLAAEGQRAPVLVSRGTLIDGYHRVAALRQLGRDEVEMVELDLDAGKALLLAWRLEGGRRRSALEEGWLLRELICEQGRTQAELAAEMNRPRSWISERLGIVRVLPDPVQEAVRAGRIPPHGAMKVLVPMARQDAAACAQMVAALAEPASDRHLERIYTAWRKADADGRARIAAHPDLAVKAEDAAVVVPVDGEEKLTADFESIAGICGRARRAIRAGMFPRGNSAPRRAWKQALEAIDGLKEEVDRA